MHKFNNASRQYYQPFRLLTLALLHLTFQVAVAPAWGTATQVTQPSEPAAEIEPAVAKEFEGVSRIDVQSFKDCVQLKNSSTRVVLGHHRGGRVLIYELDGTNILYLADESAWKADSPGLAKQLSAGRFDIGPEYIRKRGDTFWNGPWEIEVTGDRTAEMTSQIDPVSKLKIIRKFCLAKNSSRLTITQTVENQGESDFRQCFWSRTFATHGGVVVIPCDSKKSLMPNLYCIAPNGKTLLFRPEDPSVRRVEDFLVIDQPAEHAKMGMDSVKGWVAYQTRQDQLFVKRFPVADQKLYGELAGYNLSIWYPKATQIPCCEIEPIGPMKTLEPGESDSYTVDWWLLSRPFPNSGSVDPLAVEEFVDGNAVQD